MTDLTHSSGLTAGPEGRPGRLRLPGAAVRWLSVFGASLGLLLVRFLVPGPVGQADNRDGPRLMCGPGLHLNPVVPPGDPRFFRYAYFVYTPSPACGHGPGYLSSELVPLEVARLLTPVFGLAGTLNLIALGVLFCVLTSVGIASLATGLRTRLWVQLLVAAAVWLIMADAAFFDVDAGPFSEPAALVGLLLVAAGLVYLGRGRRAAWHGLALAGPGGFLAVLAKEQYLILAVPVCLALVLASADARRAGTGGGLRGWLGRLATRQAGAAIGVAAALALLAGGYAYWDQTSPYAARLHHIQAVDMIFDDIVNGHDNAPADLRALGLPVSWAKYAGDYYWDTTSVRDSPLYPRYAGKLTDGNITRFLVTHPGRALGIGQQAAVYAQQFRVNALGDYPPSAGHRTGATESRVAVVTWLVRLIPPGLGLWLLVPLWAVMAAVGLAGLRRRGPDWHRDAAVAVLAMTGCAVVAFIPPAWFAGISTTRHMVGSNLSTALAMTLSLTLAVSLLSQARRRRHDPAPHPAPEVSPELTAS